jgi:hypothetical protein
VDLEQRRPLPGAGPGDRVAGRRVDGFHVVVVDPLARYAVRGGPVGVGGDAGGGVARHRDRPVVVLDHEHHRQLPQGGQVERLVERALVRGPLTGERDRHPVVLAARERERLPERGRQPLGDDARAGEVDVRVEQVHVPAPASPEPALAPEDLGSHLVQIHTVRDGHVMRPVGRGDRVGGAQVRAHASGYRFLPGRQVHLAGHQPGADVERGFLVRVVLAENRLLEGTAENHHPVQVKTGLVVHCASSVLPVRCHESMR